MILRVNGVELSFVECFVGVLFGEFVLFMI